MDLSNALKMNAMGVQMTRTAWANDDLVLVESDDGLLTVRSCTDPAVGWGPTDEDLEARDWEVKRS